MKSATDAFWNERAASVAEDIEVNIMDIFQRELEYDAVCRYLRSDMRLLEVGCGNGFSTRRFRSLVAHVDAFDYSPNMVERARAEVGEENNRFYQDDILDPKRLEGPYDTVVCVRVLINLPSVADQHRAVENMAHLVRTDGLLLLVEGFTEGFELPELEEDDDLAEDDEARWKTAEIQADSEPDDVGSDDHPLLERDLDRYGNEIFVEKRDYTGKRLIWYGAQTNGRKPNGKYTKFVYIPGIGISGETVENLPGEVRGP